MIRTKDQFTKQFELSPEDETRYEQHEAVVAVTKVLNGFGFFENSYITGFMSDGRKVFDNQNLLNVMAAFVFPNGKWVLWAGTDYPYWKELGKINSSHRFAWGTSTKSLIAYLTPNILVGKPRRKR
jgi:hypothetical protein